MQRTSKVQEFNGTFEFFINGSNNKKVTIELLFQTFKFS